MAVAYENHSIPNKNKMNVLTMKTPLDERKRYLTDERSSSPMNRK